MFSCLCHVLHAVLCLLNCLIIIMVIIIIIIFLCIVTTARLYSHFGPKNGYRHCPVLCACVFQASVFFQLPSEHSQRHNGIQDFKPKCDSRVAGVVRWHRCFGNGWYYDCMCESETSKIPKERKRTVSRTCNLTVYIFSEPAERYHGKPAERRKWSSTWWH